MQSLPKTPKKADDAIEKIKQSLSVKWGIQLPERGSTWSPSRRDPGRVEEKICTFIQMLYFRHSALDIAINNFEKNAINVYSKWRYKPKAENDVIPSREKSESKSEKGFSLRKRNDLPVQAVKELTESLLHHLSLIVDRVKRGEHFHPPNIIEGQSFEDRISLINWLAYTITDSPILSVEEYPPIMTAKSRGQASLTHWFRNKSAPGASATHEEAAQHFSSDDYADSEMSDFMANEAFMENPVSQSTRPVPQGTIAASETDSPMDESFVTPPTTPPRSNMSGIGRGHMLEKRPVSLQGSINGTASALPTVDPTSNGNKKRPFPYSESMRPPPTRRISRERKTDRPMFDYAAPPSLPGNDSFLSRSLSSLRSIDDPFSVSSSFTSVSTAWTSPNTSFCAESAATSFDSTAEDTDTTIQPSLDQPQIRRPADQTDLSVRLEPPKSRREKDNAETGGKELMHSTSTRRDHEQYSTINADQFMKPALKPESQIQEELFDRLLSCSPFVPLPDEYKKLPFRQLYEVYRVSASCGVPVSSLSSCLKQVYEDYSRLWAALNSAVSNVKDTPLPERSSLAAWGKAAEDFKGVGLAGRLKFLEQPSGPVFELSLHPLKLESSYRLAGKFGHDRFCVILLPSLGPESLPPYLKCIQVAARTIMIKWLVETEHHFLGRCWRAYYVKPESARKSQKGTKSNSDARYRVNLFAEDGVDFRDKSARGELDPRKPTHSRMTVKELIEWHMSSKINSYQPVLKFFARIGLALTNIIPTFEFTPREMIRSDDARADTPGRRRLNFGRSEDLKTDRNLQRSDAPVMNDGCARISRDAATAIANMLGMDQAPSVFQGRIGGAKGVWMIDALDERPSRLARTDGKVYWIEISESQLKFKPHPIDALSPDKARNRFEVNKYSKKLSSSSLTFQLLPILEKGGVPREIFKRLLREDLSSRVSEMEVAMDDGLALRKWNQETNPVTQERFQYGGIEMAGGLPESTSEKINWFVEHGFEPKTCLYLKDQLWKSIYAYCMRLESRMNIGLGRSTNAYMIADPLAVLEEGEVHIGFSNVFRDAKSGFNETMLHDTDVLVARLPAHLPSDIQKVRAVFKPELRIYRDVIVFSSKGEVSLASKLSGGDYDGDTAWICWEPEIVDPFKNAEVPDFPKPETYGIEKDQTKVSDLLKHGDYMNRFLCHAFQFNLQMNMLGMCSNYHESLCYHSNSIDSPEAISIGVLLSYLVDSAKGGFTFDDTKWAAYLQSLGLPRNLEPPAYKDRSKARRMKDNLIDQLVFHVAKEEREKALKNFTKHFQDVSSWDEDLVRLRKEETEEAKTNKALYSVLKNLKAGLEDILTFWKKHAKRDDEDEDHSSAKKGSGLSFRSVVEKCRGYFLALQPTIEETITGEVPDSIRRWQRDQSAGRSSYWDLLKASVAFYHYHKSVSFIWHTAGVELGEIKATKGGRGTYRCVVNEVFDTLKMDGKLVDGDKRREMEVEELKRAGGDNNDEFGSDVDMSEL